jgi:hypothetical protein
MEINLKSSYSGTKVKKQVFFASFIKPKKTDLWIGYFLYK